MSAGQHTPGPWYASAIRTHGADPRMNGCDIGAENNSNVALALHQPEDREPRETVANARRIVACVNFLEGQITTAEIEAGAMKYGQLNDSYRAAVLERDALRKRIEVVRADLVDAIDGSDELRNYDQWLSRLVRQLDGEEF